MQCLETHLMKRPCVQDSWGWGWTLGLVTVAVLVQLLALGYYSRNLQAVKSLVDSYQADSIAEKQVITDLLLQLNVELDGPY